MIPKLHKDISGKWDIFIPLRTNAYKATKLTWIYRHSKIYTYICMQKYVCIDQHLCDNYKGQRSCRCHVAAQHKGANRSSDPVTPGTQLPAVGLESVRVIVLVTILVWLRRVGFASMQDHDTDHIEHGSRGVRGDFKCHATKFVMLTMFIFFKCVKNHNFGLPHNR